MLRCANLIWGYKPNTESGPIYAEEHCYLINIAGLGDEGGDTYWENIGDIFRHLSPNHGNLKKISRPSDGREIDTVLFHRSVRNISSTTLGGGNKKMIHRRLF